MSEPKAKTGSRLVGLITLGHLLSLVAQGRLKAGAVVADAMFRFGEVRGADGGLAARLPEKKRKRSEFVEITMATKLADLGRFFEWNSAAVVTERVEHGDKGPQMELRPVAVVTKVDLLTWMVKEGAQGA